MSSLVLISLLIKYKYFILFPALIVEGPVLTIISAYLASPQGGMVMSIGILFWVVFIADLTGDTVYYMLGRWGRRFINSERVVKVEKYFATHGGKTLVFAKVSHGLGWPAMVAAGSAKMPYKRFMAFNVVVSFVKTVAFLVIGYYYGESYELVSHYISFTGFVATTLLVVLCFWYLLSLRSRSLNT